MIPKELKSIHSRFISWTSLPADDVFNFSSLKGLKDQIKLAIQPDKGAGYFEEDSEEGFSAQFNYASAADVNGYLSDIINSVPKKDDDSENFSVNEKFNFKKMTDKYEERNYERNIKKNLANSISQKLILRLAVIK